MGEGCDMTVSTSTARQLQKVTDGGGVLMLLEVNHASFTDPIRIVNDTRNLTAFGHDWIALPFAITLPNDKAKEVPRARLQIDNVGRDFTYELELLPPGSSLKATITMVHRSTPGVVDYQFTAPLSGVKVMGPTVTATMGRDDIMRMSVVLLRFDPATSPALFAE
jgi:hypothetical protein